MSKTAIHNTDCSRKLKDSKLMHILNQKGIFTTILRTTIIRSLVIMNSIKDKTNPDIDSEMNNCSDKKEKIVSCLT